MIDCIERLHNSGTAAQKKCFCVDFLITFLASSIDRKCPTQVQFIAYVMHSCVLVGAAVRCLDWLSVRLMK